MANLPRYTLTYDDARERWALENDKTDRVVRAFETKAEATKGGVLEGALGSAGGSVKIQTMKGQFQEERTFPGSKDPARSKG